MNYAKLCDHEKAKREAEQLYKAGEKRWGTDEETFNRIFSSRDYYQLRETWNEYVKVEGVSAFGVLFVCVHVCIVCVYVCMQVQSIESRNVQEI